MELEGPWTTHRREKRRRLDRLELAPGSKIVDIERVDEVLSSLIQPNDRVALEGDNQKQADFLAQVLANADPKRLHDLHLLISSVSLPTHLDIFERGIASHLDLAFAGPQSLRLAQLVEDKIVTIGAIHTYVELYARMFVDLPPNVALLCAEAADEHGNLFTGANTEDTPTIAEATAFHDGIVIVQVKYDRGLATSSGHSR